MEEQVLDISFVIKAINIEIGSMKTQLDTALAKITVLEDENVNLKLRLSVYETPKDSHNSSIPPSQDSLKVQSEKAKKLLMTQSLREKSNRPSGGQLGHEGTTLAFSDTPDFIEKHQHHYCTSCGNDLSDIEGVIVGARQVIDVPIPVRPFITEHRIIRKKCSCGHCCEANFPAAAKSKVCYGPNIEATVTYLSCSQYIPYKRLTEVLKDCFGVSLSQGTIDNILSYMKQKSQTVYDAIRFKIEQATTAGGDETGAKINGQGYWIWVFQTPKLTYTYCDKSRGIIAIHKHFKDGLPNATLVTDRHASYFNLNVAGHQLCLAHILRELIYLTELDPEQTWSSRVMELLRDSIHKRKTESWELIDRKSILSKFNELLNESTEALHKKITTLKNGLTKHKDNVFNFLNNPDIPYHNNASESAIRPLKVKQKVSGSFRNKEAKGANTFCQIHSLTQTAKKNDQNPFLALLAVANN